MAAWRDSYEDCGVASSKGCGSADSEALRTAAWRRSSEDGGTVSSERRGSADSEGPEFGRAGAAVPGESPAAGVADHGLAQALRAVDKDSVQKFFLRRKSMEKCENN
ncbi:unnamed protein product [Miscanthus lutarioriparius]|uniref:Uncharacterized protein n=1 Tax=Miscanthus lutarioriparius TaxID=422564 RepID=A0A811Q5P7_9POAL|nr:unnamed protein product [Miscanthus lutarioriparius]